MTRKQHRIYAILLILLGVSVATVLTLKALRNTVTFFYSPSDIIGADTKFITPDRPFRLGGLVMYGTVEKKGTAVNFIVTDNVHDIDVTYEGILPGLFREGQGVIATGRLNEQGIFVADRLLAKHDETYMPPEVAKALGKAYTNSPSKDDELRSNVPQASRYRAGLPSQTSP